jgi:predicted AAA+ superfamily ATPase
MAPRIVKPLTGYEPRTVDAELDELLVGLSAISIDGPKGVGKTATADRRSGTTYFLDAAGELEVTRADPKRLIRGTEPILIDEWQLYPESWDLVRREVDANPAPARFLLTGSATPAGPPTHTGAGRIVPIRMRPMTLAERGIPTSVSLTALLTGTAQITGDTEVDLRDYVAEILSGGFPALRGLSGQVLRAQLDGYLARVIDRDFPEQGLTVRHPDTLRAWLRAYAAATSTTASYEVIRDAATPDMGNKPAKTTTAPYRDILTRLWLLDPVPAWLPTNNQFKQLGAAAKHHLADPALAARLLNVTAAQLLAGESTGPTIPRDGTLLGALFESLVALNLRVYAQAAEAEVRHLRTHRGDREVDFIITGPDSGVVAAEVKLSATIDDRDVGRLVWLRRQLGDDFRDAVVITTGQYAYRRPDGISVIPAALLGP